MKKFNYIIVGAGCSGLSLAYEMNVKNLFNDKTCAIIDKRKEFNRDKIWSYWNIYEHSFYDCLINKWDKFCVKKNQNEIILDCENFQYQSIDSQKFYKKILDNLNSNKNIKLILNKSVDKIYENKDEAIVQCSDEIFRTDIIFNSSLDNKTTKESELFQHFYGCEVVFDENVNLPEYPIIMDFNCNQDSWVHFFYTLPMGKNKIFIENTWISNEKSFAFERYIAEINYYIQNNLNYKKKYKTNYSEIGSIPMFHFKNNMKYKKIINIGTAGNLTRKSTGYTFLNIQKSVKQIVINISKKQSIKESSVSLKYNYLDNIFIKVLLEKKGSMYEVFFDLFKKNKTKDIVKFLSNTSNWFEDLRIILSMPKLIFIKKLLNL
ncbi:lycopene cyclase family protein [Candidatus Fonsibacter ubiquis]|uniref:lycopene cyclase family protein n=1 Tax=Candidatus Fonsibacter ubiquis TaxID=1925548 RepID=UPI000C088C11|nr:lycopene cyclase family protein [Candidatus Fonsibacter ubiquis]